MAAKNKSLLVLLIFFCILSSCITIEVKNYDLATPLLLEDSVIRIVLVSDLHSTIYGDNQSVLIDKIKEQNPDLIILSGDIFDDVTPDLGAELLLSNINNMAPIFYVTGNHEYTSNHIQKIRKLIESYNVTLLSDTYVKINIKGNEIILAGIEDPDKKYFETPEYDQNSSMENAFRELDNVKLYKILIAHRPENIKNYSKFSFDLVLSGHTHGGQVRIPGIMNGLYAPNQGLFPKYAGGQYEYKGVTLIVCRGLSLTYPRFPRIFDPPELVVIILKSDK